jgi:PPOX class probable F420-dependent enzyme
MDPAETDVFLRSSRTARVATIGKDGGPRVSPVWFVWFEDEIWLHSLTRSRRGGQVRQNPAVALTVDDGEEFAQLRGVIIRGRAQVGAPADPGRQAALEAAYADKYRGGEPYESDGRHEWIRVAPKHLMTWDRTKAARRA